MINRIVTRGMGRSRGLAGNAGMVTMGYGGIFKEVIDAFKRAVRIGQSGTKRRLQELKQDATIWMGLIRINDTKTSRIAEGKTIVLPAQRTRASIKIIEGFTQRTRAAWEDIKISVKRIR